MAAKKKKITFHNKISPQFRSIHVDGAFGGLSPRGLININFFSERFTIPKSTDFEVNGSAIGNKISDSPDSKDGVIREYDLGVYMDVEVAKKIIELLVAKVKEHDNLKNK
jgi:hypothetical protein